MKLHDHVMVHKPSGDVKRRSKQDLNIHSDIASPCPLQLEFVLWNYVAVNHWCDHEQTQGWVQETKCERIIAIEDSNRFAFQPP